MFFENFYGFLAWHLSAGVNDLSGQGCMFVIHGILMKLGTALISIEFRNVERAHGSIWAACQKAASEPISGAKVPCAIAL